MVRRENLCKVRKQVITVNIEKFMAIAWKDAGKFMGIHPIIGQIHGRKKQLGKPTQCRPIHNMKKGILSQN